MSSYAEVLQIEWLREIALDVFSAESEVEKKRKALHFVDIWQSSNIPVKKAMDDFLKGFRAMDVETTLETIALQLEKGE